MEAVISKMRADFVIVATLRRESGAWEDADEAMAGTAIREAIERDDRELIYCWARWLAILATRDLIESKSVDLALPVARGCDTCQSRNRPGDSPGYCAGREDLAPAYGKHHPLRVLPADGGVSCCNWRRRA